ncbi:MAG: carbonic anhydrase [Fimbriimonadaceae bacterium]|nr:carbonic anhydrase [Fimbriimonadaceae bacterium]
MAATAIVGPAGQQELKVTDILNRDHAFRDPRVAFQKLNLGNRRFVAGKSVHPRQDDSVLAKLANKQEPHTIIMSCSDSRVPNEIVFDQGLGDLFVIRTAGQVPGEASYGTIEFGVAVIKTKLVVVLGHTECGAVKSSMGEPANVPGAISYLINSIREGIEGHEKHTGSDMTTKAVEMNVVHQVNQLRKRQPILSRAVKNNEIIIVGGVYNLATGKVTYIPETLKGTPVDPAVFNVNLRLPLPPDLKSGT